MLVFVSTDFHSIEASHYQLGTIDDVVKYCASKDVLGVDTETSGMDFTSKKVVMFQIGDEDKQFVIDTRCVDIEPLRDVLESKDIIKIFHNAKFDYKFIRSQEPDRYQQQDGTPHSAHPDHCFSDGYCI